LFSFYYYFTLLGQVALSAYNKIMIKQLNTSKNSRRLIDRNWPEPPKDLPSLFSSRQPLRKIRVLIDAGLLPNSPIKPTTTLDKVITLRSLVENNLVELYRYSDAGPPGSIVPLEKTNLSPHPVYEGWAVVYPRQNGHWPVTYAVGTEKYVNAGVMSNAPDIARTNATDAAGAAITAKQRETDVLALHVANEAMQADLFITERPYLHSGARLTEAPGVTVCTTDEAITIISLYLRAQAEFIIPTGSRAIGHKFNKGLFYWVGTRELLPEGWRWFTACVQHSSAIKNDKLMLLGGSVLSRVTRALQFRDDVHVALNKQANNDHSDDALSSLDNTLMLLMGAIDASARVAHYVLGLPPTNEYGAAWQKQSWLNQVTATAPALSAVVAGGTNGEHALTILRLLRNSVHGTALQGTHLKKGNKEEILMGLPIDDEAAILLAMDAMGGRASWGFRPIIPGRSHIEPAMLVDRLFEAITGLLNDLMGATPVEQLSDVTITPKDKQPPADKHNGIGLNTFSEWNRLAIRWQLGF